MKIKILGFALLSFAVASVANAIPVTVNSVEYDITTVTTTFSNDSALFMSQPWWNNFDLASQFAAAVGDDLGMPNYSGFRGPLFAYTTTTLVFSGVFPLTFGYGIQSFMGDPLTYAIVAPVPDSASTLILTAAGLLAAFVVRGRSKRA